MKREREESESQNEQSTETKSNEQTQAKKQKKQTQQTQTNTIPSSKTTKLTVEEETKPAKVNAIKAFLMKKKKSSKNQ